MLAVGLITFAASSAKHITTRIAGETQTDSATRARVVAAYGKLPLSFEPNVGQIKGDCASAGRVKFLSRGNGYTLFLDAHESTLRLHRVSPSGMTNRVRAAIPSERWTNSHTSDSAPAVVNMTLMGARSTPKVVGLDELPGKVNYIRGQDAKNWRTDVPTYARVKIEQVYPGIDLVYYGNQRQLEYDFVVAPGADPNLIRMRISDLTGKSLRATAPRIDQAGDLVIAAAGGEIRFRKPVVYQTATAPNGAPSHIPVKGQFNLDRGQVAFQVAAYDRGKPLVIDPVLAYSTYINGTAVDEVFGSVALDSSGNAYVGSESDSTNLPAVNPFQASHATGDPSDAFVLKINHSGTALIYSTYLGGTGYDFITGIAVDRTGHAIVVGATCSTDFPITRGAYQTTLKAGCTGSGGNLFITKFATSGASLIASTYLGGSVGEISAAIALDHSGNVYIDGSSTSSNFPVTAGVVQHTFKGGSGKLCCGDGVVAKLDPALSSLIYATYLGGSGDEFITGVAVDSAGDAYVTGNSNSSDFPVTPGAFQTTFGGSGASGFGDAVVAKLNPTATALIYSTYLGGSDADFANAVAIDQTGDAYVTGSTLSSNFPVTPSAFQVVYGGAGALSRGDVFVSKLNPRGSALVYSTYLGGDQDDAGEAIAVDRAGGAWVTGFTDSDDFPTTGNALRRSYAGPNISGAGKTFFYGDGFVLWLNSKGTALTYSTYLGGSGDDAPGSIVLDKVGGIFITGTSTSTDYPTTPGSFNPTCLGPDCGAYQEFITKIRLP